MQAAERAAQGRLRHVFGGRGVIRQAAFHEAVQLRVVLVEELVESARLAAQQS
jgi:hypothetical protein